MKGLLRHIFPLSLRVRFLLATAGVVLVLSLAYGMVALVKFKRWMDGETLKAIKAIDESAHPQIGRAHV